MSEIDDMAAVQIGAVARGFGVVDAGEGPVPTVQSLSQSYPTDVADLWEAVTTAERLERWFAPVHGDLVLGGRYQVEGNAGGTVTECEPPHRFVVTWEFGGGASQVEVAVAADGDDARLTLTHSGDVPREFYEQFGPGATGVGWDLSLLGLAVYVATGALKPADADEWARGEAGQGFLRASGAAWVDAAIAAGQPADAARAAGERTVGFYTGG